MVRPADVVTNVERRFTSELHETRSAAVLGIALGVSFGTCFLTGLLSHLIQHPPGWFEWPSRPAGLYRVTQGVHVTTGFVVDPDPPRQALDRLPTLLDVAAVPQRGPCGRADQLGTARRRRPVPPLLRRGQRRPLVPVPVLLPERPLLDGLADDRGDGRPRRGQGVAHPRRAPSQRPRRPGVGPQLPTPRLPRRRGRDDRPRRAGGGRQHRAAAEPVRRARAAPPRRGPPGPAGQQDGGRGRCGAASPGSRLPPAGGGQRPAPAVAQPRRALRPAHSTRRSCRSPVSRAGVAARDGGA